MSVLISGIEMPKYGFAEIRIRPDGRVTEMLEGCEMPVGKAIPVPPHGRLIDADALIAAHEQVCSRIMKFNLDLAPTIIEAEEGET